MTNGEGGGALRRQRAAGDDPGLRRSPGNNGGVPEASDDVPAIPSRRTSPAVAVSTPRTARSTITSSTFADNTATDEGGGISIDNFGDVTISDTIIRDNRAGTDGGGIENSGTRVTFERLTDHRQPGRARRRRHLQLVERRVPRSSTRPSSCNSALDGGGLANAPDNDLIVRALPLPAQHRRPRGLGGRRPRGRRPRRRHLQPGRRRRPDREHHPLGQHGGHRRRRPLPRRRRRAEVVNVTIWRNSAPLGGGIGVAESDFVPEVPPQAERCGHPAQHHRRRQPRAAAPATGTSPPRAATSTAAATARSIQSRALPPRQTACFLSASRRATPRAGAARDRRSDASLRTRSPTTAAPTLTHALHVRQPGHRRRRRPVPRDRPARHRRGRRTAAATSAPSSSSGPPPPADDIAPDTEYLSGPIQDSLETVAFTFTGTDNRRTRTVEELQYECRLVETDLTEAPEPLAPWDPVPPELQWVCCSSPWQAPLIEEGLFTFEVRAIDRAGNIDPSPRDPPHRRRDTSPPDTIIVEKPPRQTNSRAATFTFSGTDNLTPRPVLRVRVPPRLRGTRTSGSSASTRRSTPTSPAVRTRSRCGPTTATRTSTRPRRATPGRVGPLAGDPVAAVDLRPRQHHADGGRPTAGSTR